MPAFQRKSPGRDVLRGAHGIRLLDELDGAQRGRARRARRLPRADVAEAGRGAGRLDADRHEVPVAGDVGGLADHRLERAAGRG